VDRRYVKKSQKKPGLLDVVDVGGFTKKMMKKRPLKGGAGAAAKLMRIMIYCSRNAVQTRLQVVEEEGKKKENQMH
jgi:hypothetical protein